MVTNPNVEEEQAKVHDSAGEDHVVHEREEALIEKLREAEQRCRDIQKSIDRVREADRHREAIATSTPPPMLPAITITVRSTWRSLRVLGDLVFFLFPVLVSFERSLGQLYLYGCSYMYSGD